MTAYYNENDKYCAQWLRNLIREGLIADGHVDDRDIQDVAPGDLAGFGQVHFFAGLGGWAYAARLAGWGDRPIWTGSCPCQPFSQAGKRGGFADERHLWPAWHHLIRECRPPVVVGEQISSKDGYAWLDLVQADLEGVGYACGAVVLPAAGVGAPHGRHRIWFVAESDDDRRRASRTSFDDTEKRHAESRGSNGGLAESSRGGCEQRDGLDGAAERARDRSWYDGLVGNAGGQGLAQRPLADDQRGTLRDEGHAAGAAGAVRSLGDSDGTRCGPRILQSFGTKTRSDDSTKSGLSFWSSAEWLWHTDGKWRPAEPGSFPLSHGVLARVAKLRALGNAIVPQVAAEVLKAYLECRP